MVALIIHCTCFFMILLLWGFCVCLCRIKAVFYFLSLQGIWTLRATVAELLDTKYPNFMLTLSYLWVGFGYKNLFCLFFKHEILVIHPGMKCVEGWSHQKESDRKQTTKPKNIPCSGYIKGFCRTSKWCQLLNPYFIFHLSVYPVYFTFKCAVLFAEVFSSRLTVWRREFQQWVSAALCKTRWKCCHGLMASSEKWNY